jgi:hypothetical protein
MRSDAVRRIFRRRRGGGATDGGSTLLLWPATDRASPRRVGGHEGGYISSDHPDRTPDASYIAPIQIHFRVAPNRRIGRFELNRFASPTAEMVHFPGRKLACRGPGPYDVPWRYTGCSTRPRLSPARDHPGMTTMAELLPRPSGVAGVSPDPDAGRDPRRRCRRAPVSRKLPLHSLILLAVLLPWVPAGFRHLSAGR